METSLLGTDMTSDSDVYLTKIEGTSSMSGQTIQSMDISELKVQYEAAGMDTSFVDAISNAFLITIIALIFAIIAMVFAIISVIMPKLQMIAGILSILLFIFAILAPILFMTGFTSFVESQMSAYGTSGGATDIGFWYSVNQNGINMSAGPGYAWYLMIIAAIFGLIGGIILFMEQKQAMPIPAVPMQPQTPPVSPPIQ